MNTPQPGILAAGPDHGRFLEFTAALDQNPGPILQTLAGVSLTDHFVVGLGPGLVRNNSVAALRSFPDMAGPSCRAPSTQRDLWCWVRGDDRGRILQEARAFAHNLGSAFQLVSVVDGFTYCGGRDLTGYVDGTENPIGGDAVAAAIAPDGSSFLAVQQWRHNLDHFDTLARPDQDDIIGRRLSDNVEFDGAPASAHVKRTAQESFDPEAFILWRSMPWADASGEGLMFVAFGKDLDAFEAQLRRMCGLEDGVVDGLFQISQPLTGSYFWCPPMSAGRLELSAMGMI